MISNERTASLLILYGSQTGNAQDVAELIGREAARRHYEVRVIAADAYAQTFGVARLPDEPAVVFVVSTTGQGEPPSNISKFWKHLRRKSIPIDALSETCSAVFGLGDSGYIKYNIMAKLLYRRLEALGSSMLLPVGLGDDQHPAGYEAALDDWLPKLWKALRARYQIQNPGPADDEMSDEIHSKYCVTYLPGKPNNTINYSSLYEEACAAAAAIDRLDNPLEEQLVTHQRQHTPRSPYFAKVVLNQRLTSDDYPDRVVNLLRLDVSNRTGSSSSMQYEPGDVLGVWPEQSEACVQEFSARCDMELDQWVTIKPRQVHSKALGGHDDMENSTPPIRVRALIAGLLDVSSAVPRRQFFQVLLHHTPPGLHRDRLAQLCSRFGRDELYEYCRRQRRTVLEVLHDFNFTKGIPLDLMLSYFPRIKPRKFSIASSCRLLPNKIDLIVARVTFSSGARLRRGLCSSWLTNLRGGDRVAAWVESGGLRLKEKDANQPLILVGPGTGVAPCRSFLQDRLAVLRGNQGEKDKPQQVTASSLLVFGCRHEFGDYLCREEWEEMKREGVLKDVLTAFSRDNSTGGSSAKVYVQHRLLEHAPEVWSLLHDQQGVVIVSGMAKNMPSDVASAFRSIAMQCGGMNSTEAERYMRQLEASGRYQVECWD